MPRTNLEGGRPLRRSRWIDANFNSEPRIYSLGSNPPLVLAVGDAFVRLDERWNCMHGLRRQHRHNTRCWAGAFVRHFPGDEKPWDMAPARAAALGWRLRGRNRCGVG